MWYAARVISATASMRSSAENSCQSRYSSAFKASKLVCTRITLSIHLFVARPRLRFKPEGYEQKLSPTPKAWVCASPVGPCRDLPRSRHSSLSGNLIPKNRYPRQPALERGLNCFHLARHAVGSAVAESIGESRQRSGLRCHRSQQTSGVEVQMSNCAR